MADLLPFVLEASRKLGHSMLRLSPWVERDPPTQGPDEEETSGEAAASSSTLL